MTWPHRAKSKRLAIVIEKYGLLAEYPSIVIIFSLIHIKQQASQANVSGPHRIHFFKQSDALYETQSLSSTNNQSETDNIYKAKI